MKKIILIGGLLVTLAIFSSFFINKNNNYEIKSSDNKLAKEIKKNPENKINLSKNEAIKNQGLSKNSNVLINDTKIEDTHLPVSIDQANQEKEFLEKKLEFENAVERLNDNTLTQEEREQYILIYKRISLLDKYILDENYKEVSNKLDELESTHEERLSQFGVEPR